MYSLFSSDVGADGSIDPVSEQDLLRGMVKNDTHYTILAEDQHGLWYNNQVGVKSDETSIPTEV